MKALAAKQNKHQDGFASLIVAIILVLVLSLITVGFAQLTRKEQRSALDKQLNSQAYYAAETGVNDAAKALNEGFNLPKNKCGPYTPGDIADIDSRDRTSAAAASTNLKDNQVKPNPDSTDNPTGASYPCLTIDPYPYSLEYQNVDTGQSTLAYLTGVSATDPNQTVEIRSIVISWQNANAGNHSFVPTGHQFKSAADWGQNTSVLRIGLTPLASQINRADFISGTYSAFLYPRAAGSSAPVPSHEASATGIDSGEIVDAKCNTNNQPRDCSVQITALAQSNYLLSLRSIYSKSNVTIKAYSSESISNSTQLRIKNGQTLVDSTGKAQDVLRRIQVRIPTHDTYLHPDFSLETTSNICKQLRLTPDTTESGEPTKCPIP